MLIFMCPITDHLQPLEFSAVMKTDTKCLYSGGLSAGKVEFVLSLDIHPVLNNSGSRY